MKNNVELKQFINDEDFIDKMNTAFSDLRADYELTMDSNSEKVNELIDLHVDIKNQISNLASLSRNSSGTIVGLRGTGKTHLLLLARNKLNSTLWNNKKTNNLCIYLNMKRLCLPQSFDQDLFNRVFSVFIYDELANQLIILLKSLYNKDSIDRFLAFFNREKSKLKKSMEQILKNIYEMKLIAHQGNETFKELSTGNYETESGYKDIVDLATNLNTSLSTKHLGIDLEFDFKNASEISNRITSNNTYCKYLNFQSVRKHLMKVICLLQLNSITFYVDEWEKISYDPNIQKFSSFYIDRIMDDPLYFWISVVPYRGNLYYLDNGADLQHCINLDDNLVYEASSKDQLLCINYFKELVNKRLNHYFKGKNFNYKLLFNSDKNFTKLVLASMGNTRDFGTMLLKCWSEYQDYRNAPLSPGRPFKYISSNMVGSAIKR